MISTWFNSLTLASAEVRCFFAQNKDCRVCLSSQTLQILKEGISPWPVFTRGTSTATEKQFQRCFWNCSPHLLFCVRCRRLNSVSVNKKPKHGTWCRSCSYSMKMTEHHLFPTFKCIVAFGVLCMGSSSTTKGNTIGWTIKVHIALIHHSKYKWRVYMSGRWVRNEKETNLKMLFHCIHFQTLAVEWAFLWKICCVKMMNISMQTLAFTTFLHSTGCSRQKADNTLSQRCRDGQTAVVPHVAQMLHCLPEKTKPCPGMCREVSPSGISSCSSCSVCDDLQSEPQQIRFMKLPVIT